MFFCLPAFKYWLAEQWDFTYSTGLRVTVHKLAVVLVFLKDQPPTLSQEVSSLRTGLVIWFLASTPAMRTPLQDPVTGISSAVWASQLLYNTRLFISLGYEIKAYKQWKGAVKGSSEREPQPVLLTAQCATVSPFRPEPAVLLHSPSSLLSCLSCCAFRPPLIPTLLFERLSRESHWKSCCLTDRLYVLFEAVYLWLLTPIYLFFGLPDWVFNKVFRAFDVFRQRST